MSDSFNLTRSGDDVFVPVRVIPRSSRTQVDGVRSGALCIRLKAPPVEGAANKELCEFIASVVGCRKRDVAIVRGERSRDKVVIVHGISEDELRRRLQNVVG
jgi:uncharacterized protein